MTERKSHGLVLAFLGFLVLGGFFLMSDRRVEAAGLSGEPQPISGKQVLTLPDGWKYEGEVVNGKPNGKGVAVHPDGNRYEGDFVDGEFNGKGIFTSPEGDRYEGDFVDDKMDGYGVLKDENGKTLQEGRFEKDTYIGP